MTELHVPGQPSPSSNPLLVLAVALDKANGYLHQIADNTKPETYRHVYVITETLQGWGVFCQACSEEQNDYTWPCKNQNQSIPYPPQFFKIAEEPPSENTAL